MKTSLNGYSSLFEATVLPEGTFAGFRGSAPYNITPLAKYHGQAEAGGALLANLAAGAAMSKFCGYGVAAEDIGGGYGPMASQRGAVNLRLVRPGEVANTGRGQALVPFDGQYATEKLLGTTTTPAGRQVNFHAAERMVNPPADRAPMSAAEVDQVLDGATRVVKRSFHPEGNTLTIENANMPGRPRVIVDEATGSRIITVINPKRKN